MLMFLASQAATWFQSYQYLYATLPRSGLFKQLRIFNFEAVSMPEVDVVGYAEQG